MTVPYVILANQFVATTWFETQEKYRELYEINRKMTEWIVEYFDKMQFNTTK